MYPLNPDIYMRRCLMLQQLCRSNHGSVKIFFQQRHNKVKRHPRGWQQNLLLVAGGSLRLWRGVRTCHILSIVSNLINLGVKRDLPFTRAIDKLFNAVAKLDSALAAYITFRPGSDHSWTLTRTIASDQLTDL